MPHGHELGDLESPPTPEDHRELIKLQSTVFLAKLVVWASVVFVGVWMLLSFLPVLSDHGDFDKAMKILPAIGSFWGTITGTILGYVFGKRGQ